MPLRHPRRPGLHPRKPEAGHDVLSLDAQVQQLHDQTREHGAASVRDRANRRGLQPHRDSI